MDTRDPSLEGSHDEFTKVNAPEILYVDDVLNRGKARADRSQYAKEGQNCSMPRFMQFLARFAAAERKVTVKAALHFFETASHSELMYTLAELNVLSVAFAKFV